MTEPITNRRRWFRYSMRTMLVVVTLLCIWLGLVVSRAERQRRAVAALRDMRARVDYDTTTMTPGGPPTHWRWLRTWLGDDYFDNVIEVFMFRDADDEFLQRVGDLQGLKSLYFRGTQVTDEGLAPIARLPHLERLSFDADDVTDNGMRILARAPALRQLGIGAPQVTDQGVKAICQLDSLENLGLQDTQVTEAGLRYIGTLKHLQNFGISEEEIAGGSDLQAIDDGLKYIAALPNLRNLTLHTSRVTDQGLAQLARSKRSAPTRSTHSKTGVHDEWRESADNRICQTLP